MTTAQTTSSTTTRRTTTQTGLAEGAGDGVLLIARIGLGILMIWHSKVAWDFTGSLAGYAAGFEQSGVPLPEVTARLNLIGEVVGGIALILGAAVRLVGALMAINMLGAWYWVHPYGLYSFDPQKSGSETVIAIGLVGLLLVVTGSGRIALDPVLAKARRRRSTATQGSDEIIAGPADGDLPHG